MLIRDGLGASFATRARRITSRRDRSGLSDDLLPGSGDSLSCGRATGCCGRGLGERPAPWEGRAEKARMTHPFLRLRLATEAVAKMKPLPMDDMDPLAMSASPDALILWIAYKEARVLLKLEAA